MTGTVPARRLDNTKKDGMITPNERMMIEALVVNYTARVVELFAEDQIDAILMEKTSFTELLCQMVLAAQVDGKREILVNSNN